MPINQVLVTGAAGFIGSHLVDRLLAAGHVVSGIDNFVRGRPANLAGARTNSRFYLFEADLAVDSKCTAAFDAARDRGGIAAVWHMAANSDIPAGVSDPGIDLRDTFMTTYHTLAAMRRLEIPRIAFASTSAIYGDNPNVLTEQTGPLFPISNYGAMKLGCEGMISAAVESFLECAYIFRFPNVIGPRATHGIIYDLFKKLRLNSQELEVLGDGSQQKPYLHVDDLLDAMLLIADRSDERINCFNIADDDEGATVRFIAETVIRAAAPGTPIRYTGGNRGWVGDVPHFRYSTDKIRRLGWRPRLCSTEAVEAAAREIYWEMSDPVAWKS